MSSITVQAVDQSGVAITGLYTVLYDSTGQTQLLTGYTPITFTTVNGTSYQIGTANFGNYTFANWSDGLTSNPRPVIDNGSVQTFTAVYEVSVVVTTDSALVSALLQANGVAVANETYAFNYKLSSASTYTALGTGTTNSSGVATIKATGLTPNTPYVFQAAFAGDTNFLASAGSATYTTPVAGGQDNSNLSIAVTTPTPYYPTITIDFNATLTDTTLNSPMNGQTLSFTIDGVSAGTLTTNTSGTASGIVSPLAVGNHTISVSFAGNANVLASTSSTTVTVIKQVTTPPPPTGTSTKVIVAGVTVGGIALIAASMLLKKKR